MVFQNRMLRRIFGPKGDEVTVGGNCKARSFTKLNQYAEIEED
jgi:hypothetical protein